MTPHMPDSVHWFPSYSEGQLDTPTLLLRFTQCRSHSNKTRVRELDSVGLGQLATTRSASGTWRAAACDQIYQVLECQQSSKMLTEEKSPCLYLSKELSSFYQIQFHSKSCESWESCPSPSNHTQSTSTEVTAAYLKVIQIFHQHFMTINNVMFNKVPQIFKTFQNWRQV